MARLIDAKALMDAFRTYMAERFDREKCISEENCKTCDRSCLWRSVVSVAPTVDAVEVVRCKDCEYSYDEISYLCCSHGVCFDCEVPPNFYCAEGKRKENNE